MTDLDAFLVMLQHAKSSFESIPIAEFDERGWMPPLSTKTVVRVMGGYMAHFEAAFDESGRCLSMGAWEVL